MPGMTNGVVKILLRGEGAIIFVAACLVYARIGGSWGYFALCFFLPDLSFAGYLAGPMVGAASYNAAHSYISAVVLLTVWFLLAVPIMVLAGLIWCAHISFDRALGYGLKYATGFNDTHLEQLGARQSAI